MNNKTITKRPESMEWLSYCRPVFLPQDTTPDPISVFWKVADLYVVPYLFFPAKRNVVKLRITNDLLKFYEITLQDLWDRCMVNMGPDVIMHEATLRFGEASAPSHPVIQSFYIVTTRNDNNCGAAAILLREVRSKLLEHWPSGCYILLSSLHEVLCVKNDPAKLEELRNVVHEANQEDMLPEDWLSNSVYKLLPNGKLVVA